MVGLRPGNRMTDNRDRYIQGFVDFILGTFVRKIFLDSLTLESLRGHCETIISIKEKRPDWDFVNAIDLARELDNIKSMEYSEVLKIRKSPLLPSRFTEISEMPEDITSHVMSTLLLPKSDVEIPAFFEIKMEKFIKEAEEFQGEFDEDEPDDVTRLRTCQLTEVRKLKRA